MACELIPAHVPGGEGRPLYLDVDFVADLCLLGFRVTTARDSITSLEGFLTRFF